MKNTKTLIYDAKIMNDYINNMANEIITEFKDSKKSVAFIGLQTRGIPLAKRLQEIVNKKIDTEPNIATLDISMYRDDIGMRTNLTKINVTDINFDLNDSIIILVDDVLHTGRTIRAALDAITDYGRPSLIRLAVLIDRQLREYPIQADYKGKISKLPKDKKIIVDWKELGDIDAVFTIQ